MEYLSYLEKEVCPIIECSKCPFRFRKEVADGCGLMELKEVMKRTNGWERFLLIFEYPWKEKGI